MGRTRLGVTGLFLFGTLLDDELREALAGSLSGRPARLAHYAVERAQSGDYPVCIRRETRDTPGMLFEDVPPETLKILDSYESVFGYSRSSVTVERDGEEIAADAYFPKDDLLSSGQSWDMADWQLKYAPLSRRRAALVMDELRLGTPPDEVAGKWTVLSARAQAELAAFERPGPRRVGAPNASEIEDVATRTVYSQFFRVDERDIKVPSFDKPEPLEMQRVVFLSADAVIVLPYDPVRDRVLLIEQFRIGPHARGDADPWLLEAIAGRVDGGESWEATAHREAKEEAGLELTALEKVAEFYPSPGAVSEFLVAYVGLADLPDGIAGIHGVATEHEDIRSNVLGFAEFEKLMAAGHFRNAPLLITAQWLVANRDRLRTAANGA